MKLSNLGAISLNETFKAVTLFNCTAMEMDHKLERHTLEHGTLWKQTFMGCSFLAMLQEIFKFKLEYIIGTNLNMLEMDIYLKDTKNIDIFVRPMTFKPDMVPTTYPIASVFNWEISFILRRPENKNIFRTYYSQPFNCWLWLAIGLMAIFCCIFFYILAKWEKRVIKQVATKASFVYEMLFVFGGYCQHIPPMETVMLSRRTAYIVFLLFAYVVYTCYCSNLLSHIVNDINYGFTLDRLLNSDIESVTLKDIRRLLRNSVISTNRRSYNISNIFRRLLTLRTVSPEEGLNAVKNSRVALLTDSITIAPMINRVFQNDELCDLIRINVISDMKKYFFVSNTFRYKELFKAVVMRITESGLHKRFLSKFVETTSVTGNKCVQTTSYQADIYQIMSPLTILLSTTVLSVFILFAEIVYFRYYNLWPYVE